MSEGGQDMNQGLSLELTTFEKIVAGDTIQHPVYGTREVIEIIPSNHGRKAITVFFANDTKHPLYIQTYRWSQVKKVTK